jgi:recombinational DNA repair ATPase RecF
MILKILSILNYKNIRQADIEFSPKINCFIGQNGMGKTNLLDAIYYLSFCKSSSNPIDSQVMNHEGEFFMLQGQYESEQGNEEEVREGAEPTYQERVGSDQSSKRCVSEGSHQECADRREEGMGRNIGKAVQLVRLDAAI